MHNPNARSGRKRGGVVHMALIHRNGRTYIYRSVRQRGKVTSEYGGSGETARLIGRMEAIERDERECDRSREQAERRELDDLEEALDNLVIQANALARDALTTAGYHQHHRGKWRKRRVKRCRETETRVAHDGPMGGYQAHRVGRG